MAKWRMAKKEKEEAETETKALGGHFKNYASPFANKPLNRCSTTAAISVLRQQLRLMLSVLLFAPVCVLVPNECISSLNSISCNLHNAAQQKGLTLPSKRSFREFPSTRVESECIYPKTRKWNNIPMGIIFARPKTQCPMPMPIQILVIFTYGWCRSVCDCWLVRIDKQADIRYDVNDYASFSVALASVLGSPLNSLHIIIMPVIFLPQHTDYANGVTSGNQRINQNSRHLHNRCQMHFNKQSNHYWILTEGKMVKV